MYMYVCTIMYVTLLLYQDTVYSEKCMYSTVCVVLAREYHDTTESDVLGGWCLLAVSFQMHGVHIRVYTV